MNSVYKKTLSIVPQVAPDNPLRRVILYEWEGNTVRVFGAPGPHYNVDILEVVGHWQPHPRAPEEFGSEEAACQWFEQWQFAGPFEAL